MIVCLLMVLIGAALVETPIVGYMNGEMGIAAVIAGVVFGALFIIPGIMAGLSIYKDKREERKKNDPDEKLKKMLEELTPGFREAKGSSYLDRMLVEFRQHYSAFFDKTGSEENEEIQKDVTQIYRNIMQLQKERLNKLGLTCQLLVKRMAYTREDGIYSYGYTDGKYGITDVREEVAAKTIYKKDGKEIFTKADRDMANYTIIQARKVGEDNIICPNCGAATTREALLDGCDFCGTKFTVEDLGSRIAVFAFRPNHQLRYEKYRRNRNKLLVDAAIIAVLAVFTGFTIYAVANLGDLIDYADGGIILSVLASIFGIVVSSPVYIVSFIIVHLNIILPLVLIAVLVSLYIAKQVKKRKEAPMMDRQMESEIRKYDPNFSLANFYSGVQNKLSTVLFANDNKQIQAFAQTDLSGLLGKYSNVVGVDVDSMAVTGYTVKGGRQRADVDVSLILTRYTGKKCVVRRERMKVHLVKAADCMTQVVCAPAVLKCKGCGSSIDLLSGRHCEYCGRELDLVNYDWMIDRISA